MNVSLVIPSAAFGRVTIMLMFTNHPIHKGGGRAQPLEADPLLEADPSLKADPPLEGDLPRGRPPWC